MTPEDRALLAEVDLLTRVFRHCDEPPMEDPFEGLPHGSPVAMVREREEAALAAAIDAAAAVGVLAPERAQQLRALWDRFDAEPALPAVDPAGRAELLAELERLLPDARRALEQEGAEWRPALLFDEIVEALELTGALTAAPRWGGVGAGPHAVHGRSLCPTPVPRQARALRVSHGGARWEVPLPTS